MSPKKEKKKKGDKKSKKKKSEKEDASKSDNEEKVTESKSETSKEDTKQNDDDTKSIKSTKSAGKISSICQALNDKNNCSSLYIYNQCIMQI